MAEGFSPPSFWSGTCCQVGRSRPSWGQLQSCSCCHHFCWLKETWAAAGASLSGKTQTSLSGCLPGRWSRIFGAPKVLGLVRNESVLCCTAGKCHMVRQGPVFLRPPSWDWSRFCEIWAPWLIKERPAVWFGHGGSMSMNECLCAQESEVSRQHHWSPRVTC